MDYGQRSEIKRAMAAQGSNVQDHRACEEWIKLDARQE